MAINCRELFEQMADAAGPGLGNARFTRDWIMACNRALDELSTAADRATKIAHISSTDTAISVLSEHYEYILEPGIAFHLTRMGHRPSDPKLAAIVYADTRDRWDAAKAEYVMDLDNIAQSDTEANIIALGYVGDTSDT